MVIPQKEADQMIAEQKSPDEPNPISYPGLGSAVHVPLHNGEKSEKYMLDIQRGRIALTKINHNLRVRTSVPLVRLDINGSPHQNPDGTKVSKNHLHLYREGYGDSWATEIDPGIFSDLDDIYRTLHEFVDYCNIVNMPPVDRNLF